MPRAVCTANVLRVRVAASLSSAALGSLSRGEVVDVLGTDGAWFRIRTAAGLEGFCHGDFLRFVADASPSYLRDDPVLVAAPLPPAVEATLPTSPTPLERSLARDWNAVGGLLDVCASRLLVPPAAVLAVVQVESGGNGFAPDGRLVVRFENHLFFDLWGEAHPAAYTKQFRFSSVKRWQLHEFRSAPSGPWRRVHDTQDSEWKALTAARAFDDGAALRSTSLGAPQILGRHHARLGYDSVQGLLQAFTSGIRWHLLGLFDFLRGDGLGSPALDALRRERFVDFAAYYNGPGNAADYGARLAAASEAARPLLPG